VPKPFHVERAPLLSAGVLILGLALLEMGLMSLTTSILQEIGGWAYWLIAIGVILLIIGIAWLAKLMLRVRKYRALLAEERKAVLVSNLDEIEYMAWRLPSKYEGELAAKKKDMGLK